MKEPKSLLICCSGNALFFLWTYATHVYRIDWVVVGVFHELLIFPMIALAPLLFLLSIWWLLKKRFQWALMISLLISGIVTAIIVWLFYQDLS